MKYLAILLIGILTNCSSPKEMQKEPLLYFGKTACLGKCPVYDIYVFENGKVKYEGVKNVNKKGSYSYQLSKKDIEEITEELIRISSIENEKLTRDKPNTIIRYKGKELKTQNIKNFEKLEKLLEKVIS